MKAPNHFSIANKLFWKSVLLPVVFFGTFLFTIAQRIEKILLYFEYYPTFESYYREILFSQGKAIIYFILFLFLAFEFLSHLKKANLSECFDTIGGSKLKLYLHQVFLLCCLAFFIFVAHFSFDLYFYLKSPTRSLTIFLQILKIDVLNVFLICVVAICIGALIALFCKRYLGYALLILVVFLTSPLTDTLIASTAIREPLFYKIKDFFNFFPVNLDIIFTLTVGSIEAPRWNVVFFWIGFCIMLFLIFQRRLFKNRTLPIVLSAVLFMSCVFQAQQYFSVGNMFVNNRRNLERNELYHLITPGKDIPADFTIQSYTMDLDLSRQLEAVCTVTLSEQALPSYRFTLSYSYDLRSVTDQDGRPLSYEKDGDYLTVYPSGSQRLESITFTYSGDNTTYRTNSQQITLPGFYPYYPFAGFLPLYNERSQSFLINKVPDALFDVSIKASVPFITNLDLVDGRYRGNTDGLSIIGGLLRAETIGAVSTARLLLSGSEEDYLWLTEIEPTLNELYDLLSVPNEKRVSLKDKLIVPPFASSYNQSFLVSGAAVFEDHIVLLNSAFGEPEKMNLNAVVSILAADIEPTDERIMLQILFFEDFLYNFNDEFYTKYSDVTELLAAEANPNEVEKLKLGDQFYRLIQKLGEQQAASLVYNYLCDESDGRTPQQFLEEALAG